MRVCVCTNVHMYMFIYCFLKLSGSMLFAMSARLFMAAVSFLQCGFSNRPPRSHHIRLKTFPALGRPRVSMLHSAFKGDKDKHPAAGG